MRLRWPFVALALLAPLACNAILGAGEPTIGSGGSGARAAPSGGNGDPSGPGSGSGAGAAACSGDEACVGVGPLSLVVRRSKEGCTGKVYPSTSCDEVLCSCVGDDAGSCDFGGALDDCYAGGGHVGLGPEFACSSGSDHTGITLSETKNGFECRAHGSSEASAGDLCVLGPTSCGLHASCLPADACVIPGDREGCPPDFTDLSYVALGHDDAACECSCTACGQIQITVWDGEGCDAGASHQLVPTGSCVEIPSGFGAVSGPSRDPGCLPLGKPKVTPRLMCCRSTP